MREQPVYNKLAERIRNGDTRQEVLIDAASELERLQRALERIMGMGPSHKGDKRWLIARDAVVWRPPVEAIDAIRALKEK